MKSTIQNVSDMLAFDHIYQSPGHEVERLCELMLTKFLLIFILLPEVFEESKCPVWSFNLINKDKPR